MVRIQEAILVEGRYDKNTLRQVVDTAVFTTEGFGVFNDKQKLSFLRTVAERRGLIILTDSDGAGFVIRNYLRGALPKGRVLHAYIPDIPGKEKRKATPGKEGKLGVEGMSPEILLEALRRAGATIDEQPAAPSGDPITKLELFELGLTGKPDSSARRERLLQYLHLPAHMTTNALLEALNVLYDRDTFLKNMGEL